MKKLYMILAITMYNSVFGCVVYNPATNTYTVDHQGSIDLPPQESTECK